MFTIDGVVPIIPTPFTRDGAIEWPSLNSLLEFAVRAGVCAICLPAYASEFYKLLDGERLELVSRATAILKGRLPVVAQINHPSTSYVAETARCLERAGAAAICTTVPRLFDLPDRDLFRHFDRILRAISIPLIIQDFHPGGATVTVDFVKTLHAQHNHFRYLKLEEPLMSGRVRSIVEETNGGVGVLDGWGGAYMLELIDAGIVGVMPGLGISDVLQVIWKRARLRDKDGAYSLFQGVLPQITFSLQSLEFFHHAEKALLVARGILPHAYVRDVTLTLDETDRAHIEFLNRKVIELVLKERIGDPLSLSRASHE